MTSTQGANEGNSEEPTHGESKDEAWARKTFSSFEVSMRSMSLGNALQKYHAVMEARLDRLAKSYFANRELACYAGCSVCCHQPLVLHLVEIAELYFRYESRFSKAGFLSKLQAEVLTLDLWRGEGLTTGPEISSRYFREARPCVLLGEDGKCSVYKGRPFMCRNLLAPKVCTFESVHFFGFATIGRLDKQMLEAIGKNYDLNRFDTRPNKPETPWFFLGEGLWWLSKHPQLEEIRILLRA